MLIPRIFHRIWLGPDPLPAEYAGYGQTWLDHHPGWELRFWTEDNFPDGLRRPESRERLRSPVERANILRLELVRRFGGVYLDADFECLRSIEPLIEDADFFIGRAKPDRVNNALFGAVAGHPILERALDEIRPSEVYGHNHKEGTGRKFLGRILAGHEDEVLLLEPQILYARTPAALEKAYAIHHEARTWRDADLLRVDLQRAEQKMQQALQALQRMEKALQKAERWRARYKAAEAELVRPWRAWPYRLGRRARVLLRRNGT